MRLIIRVEAIVLKNSGNHLHSKEYYFKKGITWSLIGSNQFASRLINQGFVFGVGGSCGFADSENYKVYIVLLSSKVSVYILNILNPTVNNQVGDIKNIPIADIDEITNKRISQLVDENVNIFKSDWDSFETSWDFKKHPLV